LLVEPLPSPIIWESNGDLHATYQRVRTKQLYAWNDQNAEMVDTTHIVGIRELAEALQ
jgi:hypothetical protein